MFEEAAESLSAPKLPRRGPRSGIERLVPAPLVWSLPVVVLKVFSNSATQRRFGYHAVIHGEKGWNGVAVLSRTPAEAETRGLPGRENDGARLLCVQVSGLHFATVYCPNGKTLNHPDFPRKLAWLDALRDYLVGLDRDVAFVIGGDFNIVPAALDCWLGRRGRRFDLLHHRGAIPVPVPPRSEAHGLVSPRAPGGAEVLLVGLPGRFLPSRSGAAHRSAAGYARRGVAGAPRRD